MIKLQPPEIPKILKNGPLEFGNRKHIETLRCYKSKIKKYEKDLKGIKTGKLKQYEVTVTYEGWKRTWVMAASEEHAVGLAEAIDTPYGTRVKYVDAVVAS